MKAIGRGGSVGLHPNRWLCSSPSFPQGDFLALMSFSSCKGRSSQRSSDSGPLSEGEPRAECSQARGSTFRGDVSLGAGVIKKQRTQGFLARFYQISVKVLLLLLIFTSQSATVVWLSDTSWSETLPPDPAVNGTWFFLYQVVWLAVTHLQFCWWPFQHHAFSTRAVRAVVSLSAAQGGAGNKARAMQWRNLQWRRAAASCSVTGMGIFLVISSYWSVLFLF